MDDVVLITIAEACGLFPKRGGRKLSIKSVRRRILKGERGVRLKAVRDGGQWFTAREWVAEYLSAVTAKCVPCVVSPSAIAREVARSRAILRRRFRVNAAK